MRPSERKRAPLCDRLVRGPRGKAQGGSPASRLERRSGSDDAREALGFKRFENLVSRPAPARLSTLMARNKSSLQFLIENFNLTLH
jgi:hypothetical protein